MRNSDKGSGLVVGWAPIFDLLQVRAGFGQGHAGCLKLREKHKVLWAWETRGQTPKWTWQLEREEGNAEKPQWRSRKFWASTPPTALAATWPTPMELCMQTELGSAKAQRTEWRFSLLPTFRETVWRIWIESEQKLNEHFWENHTRIHSCYDVSVVISRIQSKISRCTEKHMLDQRQPTRTSFPAAFSKESERKQNLS